MKVLGIITARGGSKSIPGKNLVEVGGRSLLEYTTTVALQSQIAKVVLSTDDEGIAKAGQELGAEVPFMRSPHLALDTSKTVPVLQEVVARLEEAGERYDAVFTLQPTNPLRLVSDIDGAIVLMRQTDSDSVIGFSNVGERHPARMKMIDDDGSIVNPPFAEQFEGQRRQDLPPLFLRDGSVYLTRRDVLMNDNSIQGKHCQAWLIPTQRALNIDDPFDLVQCEWLLSLDPENFPGSTVSPGV